MKKFILSLIVALLMIGCRDKAVTQGQDDDPISCGIDLDSILQRGSMRVLTDYNSVNYFVYKGFPVGYQFELLTALCAHLGITLEIKVSNDKEKNIRMLLSGEADLIATNLAVTSKESKRISYTIPHSQSRQILVQRNWEMPAGGKKKANKLIRTNQDLLGKTIYVLKNSSYVDCLQQIGNQLSDSIGIVEIPDYDVEQLMQLVAEGEIPYTVCFENIALVNKGLYPNLDIKMALSDPCDLAWAVRPDSKMLLSAVNQWMKGFKEDARYQRIYRRYFVNYHPLRSAGYAETVMSGDHNAIFDDIIKANVRNTIFDWRLIAALIYQESRFDPNAESWAGAVGLMQLMPETARIFGVESMVSPQDNIEGGIKFLTWLDEKMQRFVPDKNERLKFVLAAYNVGIGHVIDAIRLAEKFGKNPAVWDNQVDHFLLNKSNPAYYSDPVVKFGYCRGDEPYQYVKNIVTRFNYYKTTLR